MPLNCCYGPNLLNPSKGVIGVSKEIPYTLVDQRAAKLQALKVCASRDSNPGRPKSNDSLINVANGVASNPKCLNFFLTAKFEGSQL